MDSTQQLRECLPYFQSHCSLVSLVPLGRQPIQHWTSCFDFLVTLGESVISLLATSVAVAVAGVDGELASDYQMMGESLRQGWRTRGSWMSARMHERKASAEIEVIAAPLLVPALVQYANLTFVLVDVGS